MRKSVRFNTKKIKKRVFFDSLIKVKNMGCVRKHKVEKFGGTEKSPYLCIVNQKKRPPSEGEQSETKDNIIN